MARTMKEVVGEYNSIMAANKTQFSTVAAGEKAIVKAKQNKQGGIHNTAHTTTNPGTTLPARSAVSKNKVSAKSKKTVGEKKNFKQRITCEGVPYRGVKEAFEKLELPVQKHGRFRLKLYAEGEAAFEHEGKSFNFVHIK
jgi:hypothetical protein